MNLTNYQILYTVLDTNKYVHTNNSDTSSGTKLVIDKDRDSENYNFLLFPVDPEKTEDTDYFYIVHAESGLVLGAKNQEVDADQNVVLANISESHDQHWMFNFADYDEAYEIQNRQSSDLVWMLDKGNTSSGTNIELNSNRDDNRSYFVFQNQNDEYCPNNSDQIPNPDLLGYSERFTDITINDPSLVPEAAKDASSYGDTDEVVIGECSAPYFMINDDTNRSLSDQVRETPYYILRRSQYWKFLDNVDIPAGDTYTDGYVYTYGATEEQTDEFNQITDWELSANLSANYYGVSAGISGSVGQSLEIKSSTTTGSYTEEVGEITNEFAAVDYERILYFWQIVDVIRVLDGAGNEIKTIELDGVATVTTLYSAEDDSSDDTRPSIRQRKRAKNKKQAQSS